MDQLYIELGLIPKQINSFNKNVAQGKEMKNISNVMLRFFPKCRVCIIICP